MRLDWGGRRCFVVGGGPSLKDFDWPRLRGELVLAVNAAVFFAPATACFVQDRRVLDDLFRGLGWPECPVYFPRLRGAGQPPAPSRVVELEGVDGPLGQGVWSRTWPEIAWSSHAGPAAVNLVQLFGASRIFLLGFDYSTAAGKNFHDEYPWPDESAPDPFDVWRRDMERLAPNAPEARIIGPSGLRCFERVTLEEALAHG